MLYNHCRGDYMDVTLSDIDKSIKEYKEKHGFTPKLKEWTVKNGFPCNKETLLNHFGKYNEILKELGHETYSYGKRRYNKEVLLNDLREAILKHRSSDYQIIKSESGIIYREIYDRLFGSYFDAIEMCGITRNKMYLIKMYDDYNLEDEKQFIIDKEFNGALSKEQKDILDKCASIKDSMFTRDYVCSEIGMYKIYKHFKQFSILCVMANKTIKGLFKRQHRAKDGHICDSYEECVVDNFLSDNGISHLTQVQYPNSRFKCDFVVNGVFIEYTKFKENDLAKDKYNKTLNIKREICKSNGISLIEINSISENNLNLLYQRLLSEMIVE